ncbi:hypothetical protein Dsin_015213 [Dipteronia sinensis]|uniref:GATA-type domain-containing protein n=1 Tax=Dipteronia sinensis TaxID=43782 RepID=A0AAE0AC11_9ROSI|nr:hypothetical protein Dsin_015213 [Dipteronia sinensis]
MTPNFPIELKQDHHHDHDLNQHHHHQFFVLQSQSAAAASPGFYDQRGYYYHREQSHHHLLHHHQQEAKVVYDASQAGGSCDHNQTVVRNESENMSSGLKFTILKKEDRNIHHDQNGNSAAKWMSSKMRLMKKMMDSEVVGGPAPADHHISNNNPTPKFDIEDHNKQFFSSSTSETENSFNIINNNTNTIRVCSDCNTTKTPLWRSGPRGPKSLCNACGIRQRKARRAMAAAAAAAANGTILAASDAAPVVQPPTNKKINKVQQNKDKATTSSNNNSCLPFKKRCKMSSSPTTSSKNKKKQQLGFEDLSMILSKNSAYQRVFPQDEKEAAILLMALSYGLVHG